MVGGHLRSFRLGNRAELLAEQLLAAIAFTARVPIQEDVGADFFCTLATLEGELIKSGPFFQVQAKSNTDPLVYEKPHHIDWITNLENPLFVCVVDRPALAMDVYSTWNVMCAQLAGGKKQMVLKPGAVAPWPGVAPSGDDTLEVSLGPPIVRIGDSDIFDDAKVDSLERLVREWIQIDRRNITSRSAHINWVRGPLEYQTGVPLSESGSTAIATYWHPDNVDPVTRNLGLAAASLVLIARTYPDQGIPTDRVKAAEDVLRSHWRSLDDATRNLLLSQGVDFETL